MYIGMKSVNCASGRQHNGAGIEGAVFGHIETHKNLVDRICSDLGIKLLLPIWNIESTQIFWNMRLKSDE